MKKLVIAVFLLSATHSNVLIAKEIHKTLPKWLKCDLVESEYSYNKTLFVSFPNLQVWSKKESYNGKNEARTVFGKGLTIHKTTYSNSGSMGGNYSKRVHSLNGSNSDTFLRYAVSQDFHQMEFSEIKIKNGIITSTPTINNYHCRVIDKPEIISNYEVKYFHGSH